MVNNQGVIVQVNGSHEFNLADEEAAKTFYLIDQEERNRLVNILFDMVQTCAGGDAKELVPLLESWIVEGISNADVPLFSMDVPSIMNKI